MSGMDRLTELLPCPFCGGNATLLDIGDLRGEYQAGCDDGSCGISAYAYSEEPKEAIAAWNRRASQAAPAPSEPTGDRAVLAQVLRTRGKANSLHDIMRAADFLDAPAPSDGLRKALTDLYQCDEWGRFSFDEVKDRVRPLLAALSASPAQEGDRPSKPVCPICKGHSRFDQCSCHYEARHD